MSIEIDIVAGPLPSASSWEVPGAGAVLRFEGVVRAMEQAARITALCYEVYEPMTRRELDRLARDVMHSHELIALRMAHSEGEVPVGATSFRLEVAAAHRKPALAGMDQFIDDMKQRVPIWKVPVWVGQTQDESAAHGTHR